jgi:hypothetical protein
MHAGLLSLIRKVYPVGEIYEVRDIYLTRCNHPTPISSIFLSSGGSHKVMKDSFIDVPMSFIATSEDAKAYAGQCPRCGKVYVGEVSHNGEGSLS